MLEELDIGCNEIGAIPALFTAIGSLSSLRVLRLANNKFGPKGCGLLSQALASSASNGSLCVLDVRTTAEWNSGHIEGAVHVPLPELPQHADRFVGGAPVVTVCNGGYRSAIAAALLERAGTEEVIDQLGGMTAWKRAGCSITTEIAPSI